jgi:threonine/homoserine/homoserine lactone efflux protein
MVAALIAGLGLGLLVAAQVGPVSLLCIRTVLRFGLGPGLAVGLGAALVDTAYGALGMVGVAQLLRAEPVRLALGLIGAGILVYLGVRTLWAAHRIRIGLETEGEVTTPTAALRTALIATASNPLTIIYWATAFAAASTAALTPTAGTSAALLMGVAAGTSVWFTFLACVAALARRRIGDRAAKVADTVAGLGLVGFGGLLGVRTLQDTA